MNQQIRELWAVSKTPTWSIDNQTHDHELFAQLIVAECISIMKSTVDESIDFQRKLDETSYWIESDIKKHFGVEL